VLTCERPDAPAERGATPTGVPVEAFAQVLADRADDPDA
jgi:hypothetical protein